MDAVLISLSIDLFSLQHVFPIYIILCDKNYIFNIFFVLGFVCCFFNAFLYIFLYYRVL